LLGFFVFLPQTVLASRIIKSESIVKKNLIRAPSELNIGNHGQEFVRCPWLKMKVEYLLARIFGAKAIQKPLVVRNSNHVKSKTCV
jgi:hypothetical protein